MGARVDQLEVDKSALLDQVQELQVSKQRDTIAFPVKELVTYRANADLVVCKLTTEMSALKK